MMSDILATAQVGMLRSRCAPISSTSTATIDEREHVEQLYHGEFGRDKEKTIHFLKQTGLSSSAPTSWASRSARRWRRSCRAGARRAARQLPQVEPPGRSPARTAPVARRLRALPVQLRRGAGDLVHEEGRQLTPEAAQAAAQEAAEGAPCRQVRLPRARRRSGR